MTDPTFIHTFVPGTSPTAPTLLLLHGTGGNEESLLELGRELLPQANLLSPRGKILEDNMPRFFRRLSEGVFDVKDLQKQTANLAAFIAASRNTYHVAESPLYAVGYSNGANIAANLLLSFPDILQGAVLLRPMLPRIPETLPKNSATPILILSGEHDPLVPHASVEKLCALLQEGGAAAELSWQPTGHNLTMSDILKAKEWLTQSL